MARARDQVPPLHSAHKLGFVSAYQDTMLEVRGAVRTILQDMDGHVLLDQWTPNVVTLDAGLLLARLLRNNQEPPHGINMLAVGTGALGAVLNPDKGTREQRRLNNEIARKPFAEVTFRDENGAAVAIPTRVLDFTTIFGESEAVGPLNEMGLVSTISNNPMTLNLNPNFAGQGGQAYDPTIDVTLYDIFVNYLTFAVVSKPNNSILTITWRLTMG